MPRLDGVVEAALYVADPAQSAGFYQAVLGFEVVDTGERLWALGVAGRQVLLLCRKGASAGLPVRGHEGDGRLHLAFAIPAEELAGWEAWLGLNGVTIEDRRAWDRGGYSLYFRDPDGHLLELATPGVWPRVY